jgi:GNAT superfamily N-acetyltransferase
LFKLNLVEEKDCAELSEILQTEFPYIDLSEERICAKIYDEKFFLIKAHQKNIIVGFAEIEFFGNSFLEKKARLNAIFVEDAWRGQKVATKLIHKIVHECKRRRIHKLFLLVKEGNDGAKKLYEKEGFTFEKMHDKEIEGSKVEVWSLIIK